MSALAVAASGCLNATNVLCLYTHRVRQGKKHGTIRTRNPLLFFVYFRITDDIPPIFPHGEKKRPASPFQYMVRMHTVV